MQNQHETNATKHDLLCQLIPEACNNGEVSISNGYRLEPQPQPQPQPQPYGTDKTSSAQSLIENAKVCQLIPEICVNNTLVVTISLNQTNATTHNSTTDDAHYSNSTIQGDSLGGDLTKDELLEALLNHPRACALVPELCVNGTMAVNATSLSGGASPTNSTYNNATISMTPSGAPAGDDATLPNPSSAPSAYDSRNETRNDGIDVSNEPSSSSRMPSVAPSLQPSLQPTYSAIPTLSVEPSNSVKPSLSIQPTISQLPSISIHPSVSAMPTKSSTPSSSSIPTMSAPSYAPSMSVLPSASSAPTKSATPTNSIAPSTSTSPSLSFTPTATWPSSTPSSHPDVRSCGNWKTAPQQAELEFAYTVQITSLAATFVPEMEELILNTVADQVLDCNEVSRIAYTDPSSQIGACQPLVATAKSCWTVKSHLQLWTQNAQQAKRDVVQVIRHEFDFGEAVQKIIPNNVHIELQVDAVPPPPSEPPLSTGAAIGVTFLCLVVVLVIGAFVKVYRWKMIRSATVLRRKDLSPHQAMMDGIFPAVSRSEDEMSVAVKPEDDDGTDSSGDGNSSHSGFSIDSKSTDDDHSIGSFARDSGEAQFEPHEFQRKKSSLQWKSYVSEQQSVDSFTGNSVETGPPPQALPRNSSMRYPKSILRSSSEGSISCDSVSAVPLTSSRRKSSLKYPGRVESSPNPSDGIPDHSLERIDDQFQFSNPLIDEPERSLTRVDAAFSKPNAENTVPAERSLTRMDAEFNNSAETNNAVPAERSLTRIDAEFNNSAETSTRDRSPTRMDEEFNDSTAIRHIDIDFNESFKFRSMRLNRKQSTQSYDTSMASSINDDDDDDKPVFTVNRAMRLNRKQSTQSYDTSMASSIIDSDSDDDDDDDDDKPVFSVNIAQYEAVHYADEDDDASSSEEDRQIDDMRRQLGRQMSARISSFVSSDSRRSYRTRSADGITRSTSFGGSSRPSSFVGSIHSFHTRQTLDSSVEKKNGNDEDTEDVDSEAAAMQSLSVNNDKLDRVNGASKEHSG